jgi:transcriptional regulator
MYVPDSYRAPNPEAAVEIIAANPWAVLVSCTDEAPLASHIPVILDRERELGATLLGHLARANPHSRLARDDWRIIARDESLANGVLARAG